MGVLFSHPTANANVRVAALGLHEAGLLSQFKTSIACFPGSILDTCAIGPFSEIRRRRFDTNLKPVTYQWPWLEAGRLISQKTGINIFTKHEVGPFSIDRVYQSFDRHVATMLKRGKVPGVDSVYAYEDGALFSFNAAKEYDLPCFYDLPIGYWRAARRLMAHEILNFPEWAPTLIGFKDSEAKLARKDEELRLADRIFVAPINAIPIK